MLSLPTSVLRLYRPSAVRLCERHASMWQMYYVERVVNRHKRKLVESWGPDAACAEWLFRCGAPCVVFDGHPPVNSKRQLKQLVAENEGKGPLKLIAVDASDSVIHAHGCVHMHGVSTVRQLRLNFCDYLDDTFMVKHLIRWRNTLEDLEIVSSCLTPFGLRHLVHFPRLRRVHMYLCLFVSDAERIRVVQELKSRNPRCRVSFPPDGVIGLNRPAAFERADGRFLRENKY